MVGDGGAKLSGGQKQRLAIARCIVKKPQIIILDEATSAIDTKSEEIVQAALDKATNNRTTITIAHRLSTIQKADHIIVLQKGQAIEQGTHASLMADSSGVYSSLVNAQSLQVSLAGTEKLNLPTKEFNKELEETVVGVERVASHSEKRDVAPKQHSKRLVHNFGRILYDQRAHWPSYVSIILSSMAIAAGTPLQAWLFAKVINVFLLEGNNLKIESSFWGLMWFALAGGVGAAWLIQGWLSTRIQYSISAMYKTMYATDMLEQKFGFFDQDINSHGSLSSRIASDAKQLEELFGLNLSLFLTGIFTIIGSIIVTFLFSWQLGLIAMFVAMPTMVASGLWKYRHEVQFDKMNSAVFTESSQFATEAIGAMRTVSALTMEATINDRYQDLLEGHVQAARLKAQWASVLFGFADSVSLGCQALVFWYGGRLLFSGEFSLEAFFVCFMAIIQGAEAASQVLSIAPNTAQASAAASRVFDMHHAADIARVTEEGNQALAQSSGGMRIDLQNIRFKYPTRDVPVFNGLNLRIEKGQYVAFVGPSGCGKTTIISLLERFYDVETTQGKILCDGIDLIKFKLNDYRRNVSLVSQEPNLFRGTIRDNILFGLADPNSVSEERIHEVCRDAYIHDLIISLPEGYDTDVGQQGVSMSGGQKQRIAIARALIRDPKILLLDEATSALDSESEKMVQAAIDKMRHGRTVIAVAHRLSTIQNADIIFVFDQGCVVENGSHTELVQRRGVYWNMVNSCSPQSVDFS